ncbi:hypothetical protein [Sphingomonas sp. VNH70]|uniref:hypothetical protein n=1 Tax=Sphingomonas silueang TaxID=3156617 RepID=UPI0032B349DC
MGKCDEDSRPLVFGAWAHDRRDGAGVAREDFVQQRSLRDTPRLMTGARTVPHFHTALAVGEARPAGTWYAYRAAGHGAGRGGARPRHAGRGRCGGVVARWR